MISLTALNTINSAKKFTNTQSNGFRQNSYVQRPDSFEHSCPINFTGHSNRHKQYTKTADALIMTGQNAQLSLDGQVASDGWAGKVADSISVLWNSKNRAVLVQADIDEYNKQVNELRESIKEKRFCEKFKEIFGVEYNHAKVAKYDKKAKQFKLAVTTKAISDIVNSKLSKDLEEYKKSNGKFEDKVEKRMNPYAMTGSVPYFYHTTPKEKILQSLENALISVVGSKDALISTLNASGMDLKKMSDVEKYNAYGIMAEFLVQTTNDMVKNSSKGKSVEELKKEYDESYKNAYGVKNNIQKRVDKYNRSQEIGAAAVRGVTRSALSALVMLAAPEAGFAKMVSSAATTLGVKVLVDGSDKLTNNVEGSMNNKNFKNLVRSASISGAEKLASSVLSKVIPGIDTGFDFLDEILKQGKTVAFDTILGLTSEKLKKGNWATNQIIPRMLISFVFKNLSPNDDVVKQLLSCTKGGINQAMKYSTRESAIVKAFLEGTKQALNEIEVEDKKSLDELKKMSNDNPEKFLSVMTSVLQQIVDENNNQTD